MICYKVLYRQDKDLWSYNKAWSDTPYQLKYRELKWTTPKIGKLFVFITYHQAITLIDSKWLEIWKVYAENVVPLKRCATDFYVYKQFWAGVKLSSAYITPSLDGTYVCDRLLLIKKVN